MGGNAQLMGTEGRLAGGSRYEAPSNLPTYYSPVVDWESGKWRGSSKLQWALPERIGLAFTPDSPPLTIHCYM